MKPATNSRTLALLASVALLSSLAVATVASPAAAAGQTCAGVEATIVGTDRSETINGTSGDDVISAKGGNDRVFGRGGDDIICGGRGRDVLLGNGGEDVLFGARGSDRVQGGTGDDRLFGGPGDDEVDGDKDTDFCRQGLGSGDVRECELPKLPPEPKSTFQTTCEEAGGVYHETYPETSVAPVCAWSPPFGTPEPWNSMFDALYATCPPGGSGFSGSPFSDPNWMGCSP